MNRVCYIPPDFHCPECKNLDYKIVEIFEMPISFRLHIYCDECHHNSNNFLPFLFVQGVTKEYDIIPVPKPRMTKGDSSKSKRNKIHGMRPAVSRYFCYKDEVQLKKVKVPEAGAHIVFVLPMPQSWSEKKKKDMDGKAHQQRPDKDNLEKALLDAIFEEDCQVWDSRVTKVWGREGKIVIYAPVD